MLFIWVLLQALVIVSIEINYDTIKNDYTSQYQNLRNIGYTELNASWEITNLYHNNYISQYGNTEIKAPSREVFSNPTGLSLLYVNPTFFHYFFNLDYSLANGYKKLIVVQNAGCCGEFASTIELLIEDATGFNTRSIQMEGKDHEFPEVMIKGQWYVFDKIFTTPENPVKAENYALFLEKTSLYNSIADLRENYGKKSVLQEHGFSRANLTITAIQDMTSNIQDNKPLNGAIVEIFSYTNSYDPLVNKGETDKNGMYSTNLRKNQKYLIMVEKKGAFANPSAVGMNELFLTSDNENITIYLHKYG